MSFDDKERSNHDSMGLVLYEFSTGNKEWLYCSSEQDETFNGRTYQGLAVSDAGTKQSGDPGENEIVVTLPRSADFANLFFGTPPAQEIYLTVRRAQYNEAALPVVWVGTLSSVKDVGQAKVEITCSVIAASFDRNGLRLGWSRQCPHALYDMNCRVDPAAYAISFQVTFLSGDTVASPSLSSLPSGYLANGYFEWILPSGLLDRRAIDTQHNDWFTVLGTTDGIEIGDWITVFPGCNRTTDHCLNKFNNLPNYGGFPQLPGKSPFDGDPIF